MSKIIKHIGQSWYDTLQPAFNEHWETISLKIKKRLEEGEVITPDVSRILRAYRECPKEKLSVIILGLDPYPGVLDEEIKVADGLAFSSVASANKPPKSLKYIWDAWEKDFNKMSTNTDLTYLANQGVLLLNSYLTTTLKKTGQHKGIWKDFTIACLKRIQTIDFGLHFVLLGKEAQTFAKYIDEEHQFLHLVSHPASAAYRGGEWDHKGVFKTINEQLKSKNLDPIDWVL